MLTQKYSLQDRPKGLVYVFSGDGKGKTSAALGVSLRMLLRGKKVAWIAFYKSAAWPISEKNWPNFISEKLKGNLEMYWQGEGFYLGGKKAVTVNGALIVDHKKKEKHRAHARESLAKGASFLGRVDLLVLDEVLNCIGDKLLSSTEVRKTVEKRGETHVILTGRGVGDDIIQAADLVTEMRKIKHPFDKGGLAIAGLDF